MQPTFTSNWQYVNERPKNDFLPDSHYLIPEAAMLSCVISNFDNLEKIDHTIEESYFKHPESRHFWRVLVKMKLDERKLDLPSFFAEARELYISDFEEEPPKAMSRACADIFSTDFSSSTQNVNHHVKNFLAEYMRRELQITLGLKTTDAFAKGAKLQHELERLMSLDKSKTASMFSPADLAESTLDMLLDRENNPEKYKKLDWGYEKHNELIPLAKGHLVIIGGRSGSGKTTYTMNLIRHKIMEGKRVAVFSLEMSKEELTTILLSQMAGVSYEKFNNVDQFTDDDFDRITESLERFKKTKSLFDETPSLSLEDIRGRSFQMKTKLGGLDAIFIDHIHIMGDGQRRFGSVREKIMHISGGLKALAKELEVPIFALAQMNRNVEARQDKTPTMADLKESGSLEQDADSIVFTFRSTEVGQEDESYIICRKNRHGSKVDFKIYMDVDAKSKTFQEA